MNYLEKAQGILREAMQKHYQGEAPPLTIEPLLLPSCGLMGDVRIYGYAWSIAGIPNHDSPESRALLKDLAVRLTNEVVYDDGTRFVRVFAEIACGENMS